MQPVSIEKNLKRDLISPDFNIYINKDTCPFTLERVDDCKVRNSIFDNELCFFMLEACYFQGKTSLKK
jgi:hypothetical protein